MRDENLQTPACPSLAESAVLYLLMRLRVDPDLRWHLVGTEALARLCAAEAGRTGQSEEEVKQHYLSMAEGYTPDQAQLPRLRHKLYLIARAAEAQQDPRTSAGAACAHIYRLATRTS